MQMPESYPAVQKSEQLHNKFSTLRAFHIKKPLFKSG
jgi:hypothetical protein